MLGKILKNKNAFTFMEAMVTVIIIGICVAIWGFYGRDHTKMSMMTEARVFIDKIIAQEKMYYADNGTYVDTNGLVVSKIDPLFIDAKENRYFKTFRITRPTGTLGTVIVEVYPDTNKYSDMVGFYVRGIYLAEKDIIEYNEFYG